MHVMDVTKPLSESVPHHLLQHFRQADSSLRTTLMIGWWLEDVRQPYRSRGLG